MHTIQLNIHENVLNEMKTVVSIRGINGGLYGVVDEALVKLIKAIEQGDNELTLIFKEDRENEV